MEMEMKRERERERQRGRQSAEEWRHCGGTRKMTESWAAAVLFRPVNYFPRKLGVFSIIAKDFRRDAATVSVATAAAVATTRATTTSTTSHLFQVSRAIWNLKRGSRTTWPLAGKYFLPFFSSNFFSSALDSFCSARFLPAARTCVCRCVCVFVCVGVGVGVLCQNELPGCWSAMQNMTAQRDWPKQLEVERRACQRWAGQGPKDRPAGAEGCAARCRMLSRKLNAL